MTNAPTISTDSISSIESYSAIVNGTVVSNGGSNLSVVGICYMVGTSGDPTTANSTVFETGSFGTGYSISELLTGLTPDTEYRVRAYGINSGGTGYGSTLQLTTLADIPKIAIKIGSSWKWMAGMKINVGGVWKTVTAIKQNIGGVWKDV